MLSPRAVQNNIAQGPGPSTSALVPENNEMLDASDSDEENPSATKLRNLRRQAHVQAQQIAKMQSIINQLASQLIATPNERPSTKKPKMSAPEKYDGSREELQTFLTNINLYCEFNEVPND
jgi:hypothetical protein